MVDDGCEVELVLLVLGPLFLGKDALSDGQLHGAHDAEIALINYVLGDTAKCFLDIFGLIEAVVAKQTCNRLAIELEIKLAKCKWNSRLKGSE